MYNEFILTTYKELSLPGPSKASVSKGPEEESVLMASLGVSRGGVLSNEKKNRKKKTQQLPHTHPHPNLRFGRFLNKPKFPQILELISTHVNYCDPPIFSLITSLSISCGNKLKPGMTRSSCLCRDQTYVIQGSVWK